MIRKIWLQNVEALIRQEFEPVVKAVEAYKAAKATVADILADEELTATVRRYGTRIEAVAAHIEASYQQEKPKPAEKAETPKKKAARKKEVKDNA